MGNYVVTGADGFLGKHLTKKLLDRGDTVFAIVINEDKMSSLNCERLHVLSGLFPDYPRLFSKIPANIVDCVFHFAWQGLCGKDIQDYRAQLDDAKFSCDTLLNAEKMGAKKFVFISSVNTTETLDYLVGENVGKPRYTNIYGMSKLAAEMIGKTLAANRGSLIFESAQLAMVYGEGNYSKMVPNVFISSLIKGIAPSLIKGERLYDLIYVDDAVNALIAISEKGHNLETYPVVHRNLVSFRELFSKIGLLVNPKVKLTFGTYPGDAEIDFNKINREKLFIDTGYVFPDNFEKTIVKTSQWIKENISLF